MTTTVRVTEHAQQILRRLAAQTGKSLQHVLEIALDEYERKLYFDEINAAYDRLRADPAAWAEYQAELKEWDGVLADGLDPWEDCIARLRGTGFREDDADHQHDGGERSGAT